MIAFWIILTGSLVAVSCGLLGCFLMLRKMSMVGDAISHAVLPGIVIAYLWSGSRESFIMILGASIIGLLTTFLIEFFHKKAKLETDASIGVIFTFLFAVGVILISAFANQVDIDQDCILYGEIAYVPIDLWILESGKIMGPRSVYILSILFLLVLSFIILGFRRLSITTFDPAFASAMGISTVLWHYLLMSAVSIVTVGSFETVGAILVLAFLTGPPAIAFLCTKDLKKMLILTALIGMLISILGYALAWLMNASIAGCMAVMTGILFAITFIWKTFFSFPNKIKIQFPKIDEIK